MDEASLRDVFALMSPLAVKTLVDEQSDEVVAYVVQMVENMVTYWEREGVVLDPVQIEVVINSIVVTQIAAGRVLLAGVPTLEQEDGPAGPTNQRVEGGAGVHEAQGLWRSATAWLHRR